MNVLRIQAGNSFPEAIYMKRIPIIAASLLFWLCTSCSSSVPIVNDPSLLVGDSSADSDSIGEDSSIPSDAEDAIASDCVVDADCLDALADLGPCQTASCDQAAGLCVTDEAEDGTACEDLNPCTLNDSCLAGECVAGEAVACESGPCFIASCDEKTGECGNEPVADGSSCDDGDLCTAEDICQAGECTPGPGLECADNNPCTTDSCDPLTGCSFEPADDEPCDDENPCTEGDACLDGACQSGDNTCQCESDIDCDKMDDLNLCNGKLICVETECVIDPDSIVECDTAQDTECMVTTCDPATGECALKAAPDGVPCGNEDQCLLGKTCLVGECIGGMIVNCEDGNPCTENHCEPESGCQSSPLSDISCDDGDVCTTDDTCSAGICSGDNTCECENTDDCGAFEDGNFCNGTLICQESYCVIDADTIVLCPAADSPCSKKVCNQFSGECEDKNSTNGTACDDDDLCTASDACLAGVCQGEPILCDDNNPCTDDSCTLDAGCLFTAIDGGPCDDANPCTDGDICSEGQCQPGADSICECESNDDCIPHEDDNLCNGTLECVENNCTQVEDSIVVCDTSLDSPCKKNQCDPGTGECSLTPLVDGTICDDALQCTEDDVCLDGICIGISALCDDGNICTDDVCLELDGGCTHLPNFQTCDDDNACTIADLCEDKECSGVVVNCDDGNICTEDSCDPVAGCLNQPIENPCDDLSLCTDNDSCVEGVCIGAAIDCGDDNTCTDDLCDDGEGCVYYDNQNSCNDGDECTIGDVCAGAKCQSGLLMDCNDNNPCTNDFCLNGNCTNEAIDGGACDDGSSCTDNTTCVQGQCSGDAISCDDGNICTDDSCDPQTGCIYKNNNILCDDSNLCTDGDTCVQGSCAGGPIVDCIDNNPCTTDGCEPDSGCTHENLTDTACDDSNACTPIDTCSNGQCTGSGEVDCNDDNPCTVDTCDPEEGCKYEPMTGDLCDDASLCTADDSCQAGICVGEPVDCSDDSPCTEDLCDPDKGCFHAPVPDDPAVACDDNNLCTLVDSCIGGECIGNDPIDCNDGELCTDDICDIVTGECAYANNEAKCDDKNPCTTNDTCGNGFCFGGDWLTCNDDNLCTEDSCQPAEGGCVFTPTTDPCDDGNPCTVPDMCKDGACLPGETICQCVEDGDCVDDGNLCNGLPMCENGACIINPDTVVVCDPSQDTDCQTNTCDPPIGECFILPSKDDTPCSDGSFCTEKDLCQQGICVGNSIVCNDDNFCTDDDCAPATGCVYVNNTLSCDDQVVCTDKDACTEGKCTGSPITCDDDNVCTEDICMDLNNSPSCFHQYNDLTCDDDDACTDTDTCTNGICKGSTIICKDENPCTLDECEPATGCVFPPNSDLCDDDNPCTVKDQCSEGKCTGQAKDCDDSNSCTNDSCSVDGDCVHEPNADVCDDDNACTEGDLCSGGVCDGTLVDCDDGNSCSQDLCDKKDGCNYLNVPDNTPCDDDNLCTLDDFCTTGTCDGDWQDGCCIEDDDCDDDFACSSDACIDNGCAYASVDCDDANDCTADSCLGGDCQHEPLAQKQALYSQNFDTGEAPGWQFSINGDGDEEIYWSVDDYRSNSKKFSLYVGNTEDQTYDHGIGDTTAFSPPVFLPKVTGLELSFYFRSSLHEGQCAFDYLKVEIEVEGSKLVELTPRICNSNYSFQARSYKLDEYAGSSVRILLTFRTVDEDYNNAEGVYVDDFQITAAAQEDCCQFDGDCDDASACTLDVCTDYTCLFEDAGGTYFQEDFDSGSISTGNQWQTNVWNLSSDSDDIVWQVDDTRSVSTSYSLYCGSTSDQTYNHGSSTASARTPRITVPDTAAPVLKFRLWADLEESGCTDDLFALFAYSSTMVPGQLPDFTRCESTDGFIEVTLDLADYAGEYLYLLFSFQSDSNANDGEGVYIDNIRVEDSVTPDDCCVTDADCDDDSECTEDLCLGTATGGLCFNIPPEGYTENFDDGDSAGWLTWGSNYNVSFQVDDHRSVSPKYSFYAGNANTKRYTGYGNGYVNAYSPWITVSKMSGTTPVLQYQRYLDLASVSKHCLQVSIQSTIGQYKVLSLICGDDLDDKPHWVEEDFDLTSYVDSNVRLRFYFYFQGATPGALTYEGVFVDDIMIVYKGCE
jgi:hypothetical protein